MKRALISELVLPMAAFVGGFAIAVAVFYDEIKLGVQVRREAKKKVREVSTVEQV